MTTFIAALLLLISVMFTSCEVEDEGVYREQVVVDGFMYTGQPLSISLTHTVPIGQFYDPDAVIVTGADVRIMVDDHTYHLTEAHSGIPGTYSLPADSHLVTTGETYHLTVIRDADTVTAVTTAAEPVQFTAVNLDTVEYGGELLHMEWDHAESEWGFGVLIECLEEEKYGEECDFGEDNGPGVYVWSWTVRDVSFFDMPPVTLCYTGEHRVRLYSCDNALWNYLFTLIIGDVNNLPLSNVESGQGLFCAVGCDTAYFFVTDEIED